MKELRERKTDYTRMVQPFYDDPDVVVELKALSSAEQGQVWDLCGIRINSPEKNTWAKWEKANRETVRRQIIGWKGFTDNGKELLCNDDTKLRVIDAKFKVTGADGEPTRKPLWAILNEKFEELEEADEKN